MLHLVEWVEGVCHGDCLGEGALVSKLQHIVLVVWEAPE